MSHSLFETLYHPLKYKVNNCDKMVHDIHNALVVCTRGDRCAFYHDENDRRKIASNGCKLNGKYEDNKFCKSGAKPKYLAQNKEQQKFAPFSPFEEVSTDTDLYQRKHARSDNMMHSLPSLSHPVAVGVHNPNQYGENSSNYSFNQDSHIQSQQFLGTQMNEMKYGISPAKQEMINDSPDFKQVPVDTFNAPIYNNQLFDGNSIPSRQHSYSENSAYTFSRQYNRGYPIQQQLPLGMNGRQNYQTKFNNPSPGYESHAVDSTTPSTEILYTKYNGKIEADPFKYLFNEGNPYERRADS